MGYGTGAIALARAAEARRLLVRVAFASDAWAGAIGAAVGARLTTLADALTRGGGGPLPERVARDGLVALDVLGGACEFMRVGGVVRTRRGGEEAEVMG